MSLLITLGDFETNSHGQYILKPGASTARGCPICSKRACECLHKVEEMRVFLIGQQAHTEQQARAEQAAGGPGKHAALAQAPLASLTGDAKARKNAPMFAGLLGYFPNALAAVAHVSKVGNDQHNPGQPMHWAFDKSTDEADCILRHLAERGAFDTSGSSPLRHSAKVAWRALALLERELLAADPTLKPGVNVRGLERQDFTDPERDMHLEPEALDGRGQ